MTAANPHWPNQGALIDPAPDGATWPCGHPLTAANTQAIGQGRVRCRICRRRISRESMAKRREAHHERQPGGFVVQTGWPSRLLSPNGSQQNFWKRSAARRNAKGEGYIATIQAMPKGWARPQGRVKVTICARPPTNRRRDDDNLIASAKPFLDGIAERLGVDDSQFDLQPVQWRPAERPGRLFIEIDPVE